MTRDLITQALDRSEHRDPILRTMTLLHAARVMSAIDQIAAREIGQQGIASLDQLDTPAHVSGLIRYEAVSLMIAADPHAAVALFRRIDRSDHRTRMLGAHVVQSLAKMGEMDLALDLLEDPTIDTGGAGAVIHFTSDITRQRRVLFAARERWRTPRNDDQIHRNLFERNEFYLLLSQNWRKLERSEAEAWLQEALDAITSEPAEPMRARFGYDVQFTTTRDMNLFQLLPVMRGLLPADEVNAILQESQPLVAAAARYPKGIESMFPQTPPNAQTGTGGGGGGGGFIGTSGSGGPSPMTMMSALRGETDSVGKLFEEAWHAYREDVSPSNGNAAPRAFWPSTAAFKTAMYFAGKIKGAEAIALIDQIPDEDIAILASIEFAAGILGLEQHSGVRMHYPFPRA